MASATAHRSGIAGRLQFRLRTLLAAMLLVCLGLTFWSIYIRPYRQEARIIAQLQEHGALVMTETEGPVWLRDVAGDDFFRRILLVELHDAKTMEEDLRLLAEEPKRRRLSVVCVREARDIALARLYYTRDLRLLGRRPPGRIAPTPADEGLRSVGTCKELEELAVVGAFTDRGVRHLRGLSRCRSLTLASVNLTDDSLAAVGSLTNLRELRLEGAFTDAGMVHLHRLKDLESLVIIGAADKAGTMVALNIVTPTSVDLTDVPLVDVLEYLKDCHQLYLEVDEDELKAAGLDPTAPVNGAVRRIPLRDNLEQLLNPLGLDWKMGDYGIVITTAEAAAESRRGVTALQQRLPNLKNVSVPW